VAPLARFVPRIASRNWRLKLAALGLAVFLWALVRTEPRTGVNLFTVPVSAQVSDLEWVLAGEPDPPTVQVRLRGPTEDLIQLARAGTTLRVPLDSVWSADTLVQLRRDWLLLARESGLVVEDISPGAVRLLLQPTLTALLPLSARTRGDLERDLALAAPLSLNPQTVRVRAPAHRIRALDSIPLEPLDLSQVTASGSYPVAVDTTGLGQVSVSPLAATVGVRLEPAMERILDEVPVIVEGNSDFLVAPSTISVRLEGARTPVSGTREEEVWAVVPAEAVAELAPGESRRAPVRLRGVPALVRAFSETDSVLVQRALP